MQFSLSWKDAQKFKISLPSKASQKHVSPHVSQRFLARTGQRLVPVFAHRFLSHHLGRSDIFTNAPCAGTQTLSGGLPLVSLQSQNWSQRCSICRARDSQLSSLGLAHRWYLHQLFRRKTLFPRSRPLLGDSMNVEDRGAVCSCSDEFCSGLLKSLLSVGILALTLTPKQTISTNSTAKYFIFCWNLFFFAACGQSYAHPPSCSNTL